MSKPKYYIRVRPYFGDRIVSVSTQLQACVSRPTLGFSGPRNFLNKWTRTDVHQNRGENVTDRGSLAQPVKQLAWDRWTGILRFQKIWFGFLIVKLKSFLWSSITGSPMTPGFSYSRRQKSCLSRFLMKNRALWTTSYIYKHENNLLYKTHDEFSCYL